MCDSLASADARLDKFSITDTSRRLYPWVLQMRWCCTCSPLIAGCLVLIPLPTPPTFSPQHILSIKKRKITPLMTLPAGTGVFHSYATQRTSPDERGAGQVWTTCNVANVTLVHDVASRALVATLPVPPQVAAVGGVPHDTTATRDHGYVTFRGGRDGYGYVVAYSIPNNYAVMGTLRTAADPHVAVADANTIVVAAQGGTVFTTDPCMMCRLTMDKMQPSPHGVGAAPSGAAWYVTNIAGGGENGLVTYTPQPAGRRPGAIVQPACGGPLNTTVAVPHNVAVSRDDRWVVVTHSGAASTAVGVWEVGADGCIKAGSEMLVHTARNPFGIAVYGGKIRPAGRAG